MGDAVGDAMYRAKQGEKQQAKRTRPGNYGRPGNRCAGRVTACKLALLERFVVAQMVRPHAPRLRQPTYQAVCVVDLGDAPVCAARLTLVELAFAVLVWDALLLARP